MKTSKLLTAGISVAIALTFFTSCKKDLQMMEPSPSPVQTTTMTDLKANADFDWNTMKDLQLEIKSNVKAVLYIKSKTGTVYHKAMMSAGEIYQSSVTVPTYETEIEVLLAGQSRVIPITNDWIRVSFQ